MTEHYSLASMLVEFAGKHERLSEPELWDAFAAQVIADPVACREALDFWWTLNRRRLLMPNTVRTTDDRAATVDRQTAAVLSKIVLMQIMLPTGRTLAESTGAECTKAGGWLARVGERVGPTSIVGEMLDERQLREMLAEPKGARKRGELHATAPAG